MSEIKLFRTTKQTVTEIPGNSGGLEKSLQNLIEANLEAMIGVRFLSSEHATGKTHAGRIDTLGLDENGFPVIIEYKRAISENVINQGLYYLDWLMDHRADFKLLVLERLGKASSDSIDWTSPRLICIASDFTKHDVHSVKQINRNIDLFRYRRYGEELLALELVHRTTGEPYASDGAISTKSKGHGAKLGAVGDKLVTQALLDAEPKVKELYESLRAFTLALGDDVEEKQLKLYMVYRRIKNFASVVIRNKSLTVYLRLDPKSVTLEEGFTRDVTDIGHWGTGDLEVTIKSRDDLRRAELLVHRSYEGS